VWALVLCVDGQEWSKEHPNVNKQERSAWIQSEVIPIYTVSSITYFKCLPGLHSSVMSVISLLHYESCLAPFLFDHKKSQFIRLTPF